MRYLIALAALLFGGNALAADLMVSRAPASSAPIVKTSWSGFYLGGFAGYGANITNTVLTAGTTVQDLGQTPHGIIGGGGIGVDFQVSEYLVLGAFADIGVANLKAAGDIASGGAPLVTLHNATNYLGAAGGRLGYLISPANMLYVKGGMAFGGAKPNLQVATVAQGISDTSTGWMVGGGIEHKFGQNFSIFGEFDYTRLGDKTLTIAQTVTSDSKYHIQAGKAGLRFRF